jgi:plasmid stabilization system protein ParE
MSNFYKVIWDHEAKYSLKEIIEYVRKFSPKSADKVKLALIELVGSLKEFPEKYSKETFLNSKTGNYRSVTKWHFKIVYRVGENEVRILKITHTSRDPKVIEDLK